MMADGGAAPIDAHHAAERVARESYGRLLASLASRTRDVAGAEDALADAFAAALRTWPSSGVPDNPAAWLLTAARRRQTDALRRRRTHEANEPHLRLMAEHFEDVARTPDEIPDSRLALMFACGHPAIELGIRTPLILQTLLGLNADTIAAAFLLPPATMGQRLVRAKTRIKQTGIPFRIPEREELPARLDAVLAAIYAAFAIGWADEVDAGRSPLADEAIWLGELVVSLLPDEPEAKGMLALMCYVDARRPARRDAAGAYVPLDVQDTRLWNDAQIRKGETLLHAANAGGPTGRYQLEAAIQSAHMTQRLTGKDTRGAVLALYDHLVALTRSPVAALNRAAAVAALDGPAVALAALAPLTTEPRMLRYQPYWALRGQLLAESGRASEAHEALTVAIGLSTDHAVRQFLDARRQALTARRTGSLPLFSDAADVADSSQGGSVMQICPYLNFPGTTEEAMNFYARALGGTLTEVHRFGTMPGGEELPEQVRNRVMHVGLDLPGGGRLMASDTMEGMGPAHVAGTNVSISIHPASRAEADQMFAALSQGGHVGMPLEDQFWGDYYGHLTDRFGIQWMVNYHDAG